MGTSASSKGPGAGVSFDPPWLDDIDIPGQDSQDNNVKPAMGIAPKARFSSARRNMGEFVRSGSIDSARKSLGHYSKTGMGGAQNVARRMRTSTKTASNFFNIFRSLRDDNTFSLGREISELKNRGADASEIIDAIVSHVCPKGGSVDEISCRDSGASALSEFIDQNPDADFNNLSDDQIWSLTAIYLSNETFNRIQMDMGQAFEKQEVPYVDRMIRLNDMREYIQSEIATQMDALRKNAEQNVDMNQFFQDTIKNTFEVFEVEV